MSNKSPIPHRYYPRLSSVVSEKDIPDILGFIRSGIINLLDKIYFKDLQYNKSPKGDAAFYSLSIVSKRIDIEIPGTGIFLVLNPDFQGNDTNISAFPITIEYQWKILAYLRFFSVGNFSFDPQQIFEVALRVLNITEEQAIAHFVNTFVDPEDQDISSLQQFVKHINEAELLDSPLTLPTDATTLQDLVAEMFNKSGGKYASLIAFSAYLSTADLEETSANVKVYFRSLIPQDIDAFIKDVIIPKFRATLLLSAGIEFPRNLLVPVYPEGTKIGDEYVSLEPIPENTEGYDNKVMLLFGEALFYADTEKGFGYNMDLVLDLNCPAGIGKTGLVIDINNLKIDLSTTENIAEADADGRPKEFMGVYMEYTEVFLPKKWFKKSSGQTIGISANNLLVGTGGISGNISVRATYPTKIENDKKIVINYFTDYFSLQYPIKVKGKEAEITDHSQLLHFINIELDSPSMLKFEFPLSLTTKPENEIKSFGTETEYFQFLKDLNPHIDFFDPLTFMWFELGDHKNPEENKKYWRIGFQRFEIDFQHGQVVYSYLKAALEIKKFKKIGENTNEALYIGLLGEWESSENFKLTASFVPGLSISLFDKIILTLQTAELGREGKDFFIGADTKLKFPNDNSAIGRIFKGKEIDLPAIRIYSNGRFEITGGIGFIPTNFTLPLGPVEMSVTGIHLGSIQREFDGKIRNYNYIGFDGALSVDPIGLDIMGNGIKYFYTVDDEEYLDTEGKPTGDRFLHISTLSIDLIIPGNASEEQAIAIIKGSLTIPDPGFSDEFGGSVSIKIPKAKIAGQAYMKLNPKNKSFLVSAAVELGTPIPLGPIGIYGFKGLIGKKYVADKKAVPGLTENNTWYDYYVAHRAGINEEKLRNPLETEGYTNPFSVGLGASMATIADSGKIVSLRTMMLLSIPNMFAIDAGLAILSDRLGLIESDKRVPPFYAFLIIGDDSLEFGVGANYQINKSSGWFIDIKGEMQAGFFFKNQRPWYINFGTKEKPITVLMFKDILNIKAQGFLMISAAGIEAGARVGFDFDLYIARAWVMIEVGTQISFERSQVGGYLYIEGGFALNFWFLQASFAVSIFFSVEMVKPFLIFAQLRIDIRVKVTWLFTFKLKVTLTFKWQKPGAIDRTAIAALTYQAVSNPDYAKQVRTNDSVKGVHMLTNESFDLTLMNVSQNEIGAAPIYPRITATIDAIIPMDTFIDIKMEKGLVPSALVDAIIGSHTSVANNCMEFIPPKNIVKGNLTLQQVKHKYSIESINVKMRTDDSWVDYHPYEALFPLGENSDVTALKIGHWQKNTDRYDSIRLLATSPFSYMDPGEPGWVIPEQYGITPSSLFCTHLITQWHISNFLNIPLGTEYTPPAGYNSYLICGAYYNIEGTYAQTIEVDEEGNAIQITSDAKMVVKNSSNPFNYDHSLEFSNGDNLIITFPEDSAQVKMNLTTYAKGIIIKVYERVKGNTIKPKYIQVDEIPFTKQQLAHQIEIGNPERDVENGVTPQIFSRIEIIPDTNDKDRISAIHQEIAAIWLEAEANAGEGNMVILTPSQSAQIDTLNAELAILRSAACSDVNCKSIVFSILDNQYLYSYDQILTNFINDEDTLVNALSDIGYSGHINVDFNKNSVLILNLSLDISDYGFVTNGIKKIVDKGDHLCISEFEESRDGGGHGPGDPGETGKSDANGNLGKYKYSIIQVEKMEVKPIEETYADCGCNDGSEPFTSICTTSVQEVSWMTMTEFEYEQTIPEQPAVIEDMEETIKAMNKTVQPIWRPNTTFMLHFRLKDEVDGGSTDSKVFDYFYGFKTMGPVGHFHKQNHTYLEYKEYNETTGMNDTKTRKEDESALTSLRSYIDYQRSYPNPDGNILGSKPLFFGDEQCKIELFFDKAYVSHMFSDWSDYKGRSAIKMEMPIIIKDPVSEAIIPYPIPIGWNEEDVPGAAYEWTDDKDPKLPISVQTYLDLLEEAQETQGAVNCEVKLGFPISPSVKMRTVALTNLKPEKLYTAMVYSAYDADGNGEIKNQMVGEKIVYEEIQKVHEFAFRTSRYENFRKQVWSYQLNERDENGNFIQSKQAVYEVRLDLTTSQVNNLYALVGKTPNNETDLLREKYIHEFDRAIEGILKISPLDPPRNTDFVKVVNRTNNNVVAILVRNPEPFNDPRILLQDIANTLIVLGAKGDGAKYKVLWNKDYSQAIVMHETKNITAKELQFQFVYKTWDGNKREYVVKDESDIINVDERSNTIITDAITFNK